MRAGRRGQEARKPVQELSGPGLWTCGRVDVSGRVCVRRIEAQQEVQMFRHLSISSPPLGILTL